MKLNLLNAVFVNKAPLENLDLTFNESDVVVLSAVNGKGKTTILSYLADAFHEIAKPHFSNEFHNKKNKYYRVSTQLYNSNFKEPSLVYFRFRYSDEIVDYLEISGNCTEDMYDEKIRIHNKIAYKEFSTILASNSNIKQTSSHLNSNKVHNIFKNNILTFFPSYRFEIPGFINEPYRETLNFSKESKIHGFLNNPIEVITGLPQFANWVMDLVLDARVISHTESIILFNKLNNILSYILSAKKLGKVRFGVGERGLGMVRLQIVEDKPNGRMLYPNIFNLSSGESSLLCIFGELLRQADNNSKANSLEKISGIVLIDEIDKHLHIKLQKEVLPILFGYFPNVQFILSSHSPFLNIGLAEKLYDRSSIVDLDNFGIVKDPFSSDMYCEVYDMMINENDRFRNNYEIIKEQIDNSGKLQIVTEGLNVEYIEKAIKVLDITLLDKIHIIRGIESQSGDQQIKNAFDILSKGSFIGMFLFVWDCDSLNIAEKAKETKKFKKFVFEENFENTTARNSKDKPCGIENLFSDDFFTEDVYSWKTSNMPYGGKQKISLFNKKTFLTKILEESDPIVFVKFVPLIAKINSLINSYEN